MQEFTKKEFYQSKYDYYKKFAYYVVVAGCLGSTTYFVSDCQLFGRFATETLLPRTIILIPLLIFMYFYPKITNYRIMVPTCYTILHLIMWNTIWAIVYLPDRTHASEGFIIMQLLFFAAGFCAPFKYALIAHCLLVVNILVSHTFNHYKNLDMMISLGLPCVIGICAAHYFMQKLYMDHYQTARKLEYISRYDALTGVYNRNIVEMILKKDKKHFINELGSQCAVLMFDIDHFKNVNDTYGHAKGDIVLKSLANTASCIMETKDYLIRWGGEEFIIILADTTEENALRKAEQLRQMVEHSDNGICAVTVSVGVALYNGEDYQIIVDHADKALYMAKESGRNCVHLYG